MRYILNTTEDKMKFRQISDVLAGGPWMEQHDTPPPEWALFLRSGFPAAGNFL